MRDEVFHALLGQVMFSCRRAMPLASPLEEVFPKTLQNVKKVVVREV